MSNKMPTVRFIFNRRKTASTTTTANVELEIYFNRNKRVRINTGVSIYIGEWSDEFYVVKRKDSTELNTRLAEVYNEKMKAFADISSSGKEINAENYEIHKEKNSPDRPKSFLEYMSNRIEEKKLRYDTKRQHLVALAALRRFGRIDSFHSLNSQNIEAFDMFLRAENTDRLQTTLHGYHRRIKPYVTEAFKLGYIEENPYLKFKDVAGKSKDRKSLTSAELDKLRSVNLPKKLSRVRDLFVFCCYTGLAYADMNMFDYERDIQENNGLFYIHGERVKTGTSFFTPLLPPALKVLKKYNYKLPSMSVQKYNDYLHVIETRLDLKKPLTSHIARHTYATTVCLANGIPIEVVSRMLGHKHISTTEIYAKIMNTTVESYSNKLNSIIK
jgi:site-specific recombinase XerD